MPRAHSRAGCSSTATLRMSGTLRSGHRRKSAAASSSTTVRTAATEIMSRCDPLCLSPRCSGCPPCAQAQVLVHVDSVNGRPSHPIQPPPAVIESALGACQDAFLASAEATRRRLREAIRPTPSALSVGGGVAGSGGDDHGAVVNGSPWGIASGALGPEPLAFYLLEGAQSPVVRAAAAAQSSPAACALECLQTLDIARHAVLPGTKHQTCLCCQQPASLPPQLACGAFTPARDHSHRNLRSLFSPKCSCAQAPTRARCGLPRSSSRDTRTPTGRSPRRASGRPSWRAGPRRPMATSFPSRACV